MSKFKVGDGVWIADCEPRSKRIVCPDCAGKKFLTVILGDGSSATIDCAGCQSGYEQPCGTIQSWEFSPRIKFITIEGVEEVTGEVTKYRYDIASNGRSWRNVSETDVFETDAEAKEKAELILAEREQEESNRLRSKEKSDRSWAWHVTYHRREHKRHLEQAEYHSTKLKVAQFIARQPTP